VQRSYTAPRDFYDLYFLTNNYQEDEWAEIKGFFLKKMEHKNLEYNGAGQLVSEQSLKNVKRAWNSSIAHQINTENEIQADDVIDEVVIRIQDSL
jgi:predicted nucleotidyltransferase component of viral defense system